MNSNFLTPPEIAEFTVNVGIKKANLTIVNQFILGILAGAFIAFGSQVSSMATHTIEDANIAKFVGGLIFPAGLILVVSAGAELFTGNCLMIMSLAEKKISILQLLRSWIVVYLGNLVGGVLTALLILWSGQLNFNGGLLGAFTIKTAVNKISLSFLNAFILGMLCNWLVCLAVWTSFGAKDGISKAIMIFFPIWLFIASGFEHSVANMYYISAGIFAKSNEFFVGKAIGEGVLPDLIESLNWSSMFVKNLLPVTLGNILGGAGFTGLIYWFVYLRRDKK